MGKLSWTCIGLATAGVMAGCDGDTSGTGPTSDASIADAAFDGAAPNEAAVDAVSGDGADVDASEVDATIDAEASVVADAGATEGGSDADTAVGDAGADAPSDAGPDVLDAAAANSGDGASACNASNCGGACCGDTCVSRTCAGCDAGAVFCPFDPIGSLHGSNGTCVADCASCSGPQPIECYQCAGQARTAYCATALDLCPTEVNAGACTCDAGGADECPGSTQVCALEEAGAACIPCGQGPATGGLLCANGQSCNQATASCGP